MEPAEKSFWDVDYREVRKETFERRRREIEIDLPAKHAEEMAKLKARHDIRVEHTYRGLASANDQLVKDFGLCTSSVFSVCNLYNGHGGGHMVL